MVIISLNTGKCKTIFEEYGFIGKEATREYVYSICYYVYDSAEHDVEASEDLPEDWNCPRCKQGKEKFNKS